MSDHFNLADDESQHKRQRRLSQGEELILALHSQIVNESLRAANSSLPSISITNTQLGEQETFPTLEKRDGKDRKKQTKACDRCRIRKRKCDAAVPFCTTCVRGEAEPHLTCTYTMQSKKRGPKRGYKDELLERMASIEAIINSNPNGSGGIIGGSSSSSNATSFQNPLMDSLDYVPMNFTNVSRRASSSSTVSMLSDHQILNPMELLVREATSRVSALANSSGTSDSLFSSQTASTPLPINNSGILGGIPDQQLLQTDSNYDNGLVFDFGESLYSFQSIIGQSFMPSMTLDTSDSLEKFLEDLQSPQLSTCSDAYILTDLEDHLVRLFFSHLSMKIFAFHEPYFIANLYPTNQHPSHVIFAICAVTSLFSDHKDILEFGSTRAACAEYTSKCMKEIESFEKISELDYDSLEVVQSLMLLALVEYGFNQPVKAYRKMVLAIQMAIRLKIDQEDPNVAMNPLSIWLDKTQVYSPDKLLVRRKLWEFCLYFDTCIGLAGGLPLVIYEAAYMYLLSPPSNLDAEARVDAVSSINMNSHERAKLKKLKHLLVKDRTKTEEGLKILSEIIMNPPKETVFATLNLPVKSRPAVQYDQYHVIMNQLSFILRRVIRVNYTVRTSLGAYPQGGGGAWPKGKSNDTTLLLNPGKPIVENLIPPPQDVIAIHDALIDFYNVLPVEYKPFHSFAQFFPILNSNPQKSSSSNNNTNNKLVHPLFADKFDPTQIHVISILTNLFSAMVMLHLPRTDDTRAIFKLDSAVLVDTASAFGPKKICSAEVVLVARKSLVYLVQGILPQPASPPPEPPQQQITINGSNQGADNMYSQSNDLSAARNSGFHSFSQPIASGMDFETLTEKSSSMQSLADHHVEPTFATRADQNVFRVVGHSEVELANRRSRMPLTALVLEDEQLGSPASFGDQGGGGGGGGAGGGVTSTPETDGHDGQKQDVAADGANISLFCDPVVGFNIFTVAVAGIAVCTGGSNEEFNRGVLAVLKSSIETVDLTVMDCITYIWPVCGSFSDRLKRVLQLAKSKLNSGKYRDS
ncbi:hypothetical protein BDR26DRAFT_850059 [Obelidium mucronatum]|nr:hypothetical protein BDR26DRAFT_850059 [Obelidium mucronatum]